MTAPKAPEDKLKMGRPTLYRDEYCQRVIDYMAKGYSLTAFAGSIRVSWDTVHEWMKAHPDFADAVKTGKGARTDHLETGLLSDTFAGPQITARIFALKNAAAHEWRDKVETQVSGPNDGPIETKSPDISELAKVLASLFARSAE